MSGEQLTTKEPINTSDVQLSENLNIAPRVNIIAPRVNIIAPRVNIKAPRVNINDLLLKVKQEEKKEKKENYIFLGIICTVITVTGIIASI